MASVKLLIRGGQVYDHDGDVHKPATADILIENGDIAAIGSNLEAGGATVRSEERRVGKECRL